jgi:hypothetical protein
MHISTRWRELVKRIVSTGPHHKKTCTLLLLGVLGARLRGHDVREHA